MILTIGGPIGSGKSTVAKSIAEELGINYIYTGMIFRQLAEEREISLEEFSRMAEADENIDKELDLRQKEEAKKGNCIVDGRLSGWFIEADLKIWLTAPLDVRVKRVCTREGKDFEMARKETLMREASEKNRYKKIYDIDIGDLSIYDLVLNTAQWDAPGVTKIILGAIKGKGD